MMKPTFVDIIEFSGCCLGNFLCVDDDEFTFAIKNYSCETEPDGTTRTCKSIEIKVVGRQIKEDFYFSATIKSSITDTSYSRMDYSNNFEVVEFSITNCVPMMVWPVVESED